MYQPAAEAERRFAKAMRQQAAQAKAKQQQWAYRKREEEEFLPHLDRVKQLTDSAWQSLE